MGALLLSIQIFLIFCFFSYKMKSYLFVIGAGVIALGAVTAAREIEIVKRDIAASEEESKSLAEDPNGEAGKASLLAQLTWREADARTRPPPRPAPRPPQGRPQGRPRDRLPGVSDSRSNSHSPDHPAGSPPR